MQNFILACEEKVLNGGEIGLDEGEKLLSARGSDQLLLFSSANRIREQFCGNGIHLCGIVNAKSGACSENCNFCSQAAGNDTGIDTYSLLDPDSIVGAAKEASENGAKAFGIVTAWRGIKKGKGLDQICEAIKKIRDQGLIVPDLSLGLIEDQDVADRLAQAGAVEYNHNLEAAPSFFPGICTTHSFEDRVNTIKHIQAAGMQVCSGGIIGLGESNRQRVELALELKKLNIRTVPVNFYNHTEGNNVNLEEIEPVNPLEALQVVSVFRFILPDAVIKIAGGRETTLGGFQSLMYLTGANSSMVGHYLTTSGRKPEDDIRLIQDCGLYQCEHDHTSSDRISAENSAAAT